ncbi:pyruvate dehydrogenase complex dihydrolipoamide acetyltransferase [Candidatus Neoehrlichia lotoris str. RAC413]|uniref:Acetyltransferase component of pyruvate dehydrogenase complex n=2 Tax=Candidatus Neoehrlichia procyonis TaxID=467750 RepID=A0A0F3NMM5_9RICK|nr:pyruvate dehydrogenase complex dihydrolipoamide acetyltransferase [Candidatus Neoehrlichia lotoris str. RAC413]
MPALSPTMKSGSIVKWYKKEGDTVKAGEVIADIETDKAVMEFEYADEDGIIGIILSQEGSKNVPVNQLIALVGIDDNDLQLIKSYKQESLTNHPHVSSEPNISTINTDNLANNTRQQQTRIKASPLAKKIAYESSIDLSTIKQGTGPYNRIIKADVLEAIQNYQNCTRNNDVTSYFIEVSNTRQVIAHRLAESKQTIPHFYLKIDCNVNNLLKLKAEVNNIDINNKITVNDFIIKATALSIKKFPSINVSWINDKILQHTNIDVSFAVSTDDGGLITPIVTNADKKSLSEISHEAKALIAKARNGRLQLKEFQGGSITISNLGMFEIKEFIAIINPPQSCIMAVGQSKQQPVVIDSNIIIANVMTVTLSIDHRVIDGVLAAKFFNCFKNYIENPITMFI